MTKIRLKFFGITIFATLIFIVIVLFYHEHRLYYKGLNFQKENKKIFAIDYYSYVIIAYVPFSPYVKKAERKILNIGRYFEKKKIFYKALFAYEVLRSSYFQVRSFYQPRKKLIEKLNYKIAKIKVEILKNENRLKNMKKEYERQLKILQHNDFPSVIGSFIMCFSFLGWVGAIIFMILRGFEKENINKKIIILSFGCYLLFFSIWIVSLYFV